MPTLTKNSIPLLFFLLSSALLAQASFYPISSPDLFWHLRLGEDLVARGLSPFVDRYSFEFANQPVKFVPWVFESLIYLFYRLLGGGFGLQVFRGICWIIPNFLFFKFMKKHEISPANQALGFVLLGGAMTFHPEVRPELVTYSFIIISFFLFAKARENPTTLNLLRIAGILLLWVNYHTSCVFGFLIAGGLYVELLVSLCLGRNKADFPRVLALGILSFCVGFLNKDLAHPLLKLLLFDDWGRYILEYQRPEFADLPNMFFIFVGLSIITAISSLYRRKTGETLILGVLFFQSLQMMRMVHFFIFIGTPLVIPAIEGLLKWPKGNNLSRRLAPLSLVALSLFMIPDIKNDFIIKAPPSASRDFIPPVYPDDVIEYMLRKQYTGNVLAQFAHGSFVLWAGSPHLKVFIDGRTNMLYPFSHLEKYINVVTHAPSLLRETKTYDIDYVIAPTTNAHALLDSAVSTKIFFLEFVGGQNVLLSRHSELFKNWTLPFVHPECLSQKNWDELPREYENAKTHLPSYSPLITFFSIATAYAETTDKKKFLRGTNSAGSDQSYRMLAILAAQNGLPSESLNFWRKMSALSPGDRLQIAELLCRSWECKGAEEELSKLKFPRAQDLDFKRGFDILVSMKKKRPLGSLGNSLVNQWQVFSKLSTPENPCD